MADTSGKSITKRRGKSTPKKPLCRKNVSQEVIIKAVQGTFGIVTRIAENLNCSRKTVYNYLEKYPDVRDAYEEEKDMILDACEESLYTLVTRMDIDAIKYVLDYKGASRGFGARIGLGAKTEDDQTPVAVEIRVVDGRREA